MPSVNSEIESDDTAQPIPKSGSSLLRRIASAVVLAPAVLAVVYFGSPYFEILMTLVAVGLAYEWARLCGGGRVHPAGWALLALVLLIVCAAIAGPDRVAIGLLAIGAICLYLLGRFGEGAQVTWLAGGVLYVAAPCIACLWLRADPESGRAVFFWLLGVVWTTDIAAYAFGRAIGGLKLAPRISPNKTLAGLAGGVFCAGFAGWAIAYGFDFPRPEWLGAFGALLAIVAQGGDLVESAVKRHFDVKDTGRLIPGHGGLMDRLDGVLAAAPVAALVKLFTGDWIFP